MNKYAPLAEHLKRQSAPAVPMSFHEIERVIGDRLPSSARKHRPWWSNNPSNSVITRAWLDAGYRTENVDMAGEKLVFRRVPAGRRAASTEASETPAGGFAEIHGALRGTVTFIPDVDLTEPVWDEGA